MGGVGHSLLSIRHGSSGRLSGCPREPQPSSRLTPFPPPSNDRRLRAKAGFPLKRLRKGLGRRLTWEREFGVEVMKPFGKVPRLLTRKPGSSKELPEGHGAGIHIFLQRSTPHEMEKKRMREGVIASRTRNRVQSQAEP